MVSYCCVKGCGNNSNNKKKDPNSVISFHAFPSNQELKSKWLRAIGRPNWVPPNHTRVCSAHFNYDQINYDGCRIRIKDDAFPVNLLPPNSNFEASNVEACRICLSTDVKMHSLRDTHLATCMESVAGFSQNGMYLEGLPQYVCYQCAPSLLKCNKLIEQCMISQATLLDIHAKHGQITKELIKEQKKSPLDNSSLLNDYLLKYNDVNNTSPFATTESNDSEDIYFKNEDVTNIEMDIQDLDSKECKVEASENEFNKINFEDVGESKINTSICNVNGGLNKDLSSNAQYKKFDFQENLRQVKHVKKKLTGKKINGLTPDETNMLKYFNIVKLSLHEQIQEWEKNTVQQPLTSEIIYRCEICNKTFASDKSYRVHVNYHEPSIGRAQCPVCKLRFKSSVMATSHAKRAHSKKFFCKICPKTFNYVGVAKKHQRWHSGYLYKCDSCAFSTLHESSLFVHKRRAHANAHACALCGRAYNSRRGLHAHAHTAHTSVKDKDISKEYRCEQCDLEFASEGARRVHVLTSTQHRNKPDLCDAAIQDPNLRNSCNKCGAECASFKELVLHTRAEHPRPRRTDHPWRGGTPYPIHCELCGETITSRKKHWLHVRRQHPKNVDTYQPVITAICDTCGKGFQNSTKLRLHQLRHRSPTVRCHRCPRLFYDKYALARHAGTHNGDKPHQCRICGRAFKLLSNLDRHSRVHTDIAPYECTICGKKFKYSSSVNLHVRTVHYKLPQPTRKKRNKS